MLDGPNEIPVKWEYQKYYYDQDLPIVEWLNEKGENGWQLVTILEDSMYGGFFFKRELPHD